MKYDRKKSFSDGASISRRRHLQEQSEINNFYWTSILSADVTSHEVKRNDAATAEELLTALGYKSEAGDRLADPAFTLKDRLSLAARWRRLMTLLMAASAFERFMVGVAHEALSSDPALAPGWPKHVDGLALKKYEINLSRPSVEGMVHGEWPKRTAAFKDIFGQIPPIITANMSELDKIRNTRNAVAHEFGYEKVRASSSFTAALNTLRPQRGLAPLLSVSHERLVTWLKLLNDVSREVDKMLMSDHIGGFELPAVYLDWRRGPDSFEKSVGVHLDASRKAPRIRFRHAIANFFALIGDEYYQSMKDYVDKL